MPGELTKAQRRFMEQVAERRVRFSRDTLIGSEIKMAERLVERGLLTYVAEWESYYALTDAGRQAIRKALGGDHG